MTMLSGIIFKLTREGQQKQKKNKKVLAKAKRIWYNIEAVARKERQEP